MIITKAVASAQEWLSAQTPDSPAKPSTQRVPDSNRTPYSTLLQTDAWREDLHLAGLGWIVGEGPEKVSILAHCHYVNSPLVAEGLALWEALQFCIEKDIRQLLILSPFLGFNELEMERLTLWESKPSGMKLV
ncbi:hypothetical protein DY000_02019769 [Brassica cretica]|uniref:RNase H type-1 domain-containing protein n=1 Tax=Brassica cretica TaxID=69181 RepID=A0ABQ7D7R7_BRACR|nr:hypothetical protein DY000_02019769 [Brassica cretica]